MAEIQRASHRELFGFAMFDFANSSYTTVIITVVFCVTFPRLIVGDEPEYRLGNFLWSASLSASYLIVLLTAPFLDAIMDYAASKKMFLFISYILCLIYSVFQITDFINKLFSLSLKAEQIFLMIAAFAGLGLGSTQSACRAMVGLFAPNTKAGEFFGLWSLAGRLSSIVGLMALGVLQAIFGLQKAVLVCSTFFLTALIFIFFWMKKGA